MEQWLVEVEPKVHDHGVEMDRGLVDRHPPDWQDGEDWTLFCTGAYSVDPSLPREQRIFHISQTIGGHKITVTTQPDVHI